MSFREEDVLRLLGHITVDVQPHEQDHSNGQDYLLCDVCDSRFELVVRHTESERYYRDWKSTYLHFRHEDGCPYVLAKDMLTGFEC